MRKIPEICLRFSGSAHFSKRGKEEKTADLQGQYGTKKTSCSTRKCYTRSHSLGFLGFSQNAQMCLFGAVRGLFEIPNDIVLFPLASLKHNINNFVYEIFCGLFLFFSLSKNQRLSDFVLPKCCRKQITLRRVAPAEWMFPRSCSGSYCGTLPRSLPAYAVPEKCAH